MTTLQTDPVNKSFLSNNKFEFSLDRIPNLTFLVQSVNLPSIALQSTQVNSPFTALKVPGNIITFSSMNITFILDEDLRSWYELYDWITQLGNPKGFDKRGTLRGEPGANDHIYSDATLLIKTNSNNPNWKITFTDMFPIDIGEIQFSTTENQEFLTSSATFEYTYYEFAKVT
jgi:hypothetical protein